MLGVIEAGSFLRVGVGYLEVKEVLGLCLHLFLCFFKLPLEVLSDVFFFAGSQTLKILVLRVFIEIFI
jgi:hypothetical protein